MNGVEGIEPAAGLIDTFGNEISGTAEFRAVNVPEALLSIRHRTGIEPNVNEVGLAHHLLSAVGNEDDFIHVRAVQIDSVVIVNGHILRIEALVLERIAAHKTSGNGLLDFGVKLLDRAYALLFLSVFASPNRKRCAPEAAA